jgi:hypothetical protein
MTDLPTDVAQLHGDPTDRDAQRLALWPELLRQLDRASDLLSVCDLDAPSDVADIADIRQTLARARELR